MATPTPFVAAALPLFVALSAAACIEGHRAADTADGDVAVLFPDGAGDTLGTAADPWADVRADAAPDTGDDTGDDTAVGPIDTRVEPVDSSLAPESDDPDADEPDTVEPDTDDPDTGEPDTATESPCPGGCISGGLPCQENVCDLTLRECRRRALPPETACDDGDACTIGDHCGDGPTAGACVGGTPVVCGGGGDCREAGVCNPLSGVCSEPTRPDGALCEDAGAFDGRSGDEAGTCLAGTCRRLPHLVAGAFHMCAVLWNQRFVCWGRNSSEQLGLGHDDNVGDGLGPSVADVEPIAITGLKALSAGIAQTCALASDGVRCWGSGTGVAQGVPAASVAPFALPAGFGARTIATSHFGSCAVSVDGRLTCWGTELLGYPGVDALGVADAPPIGAAGDVVLALTGDTFPVSDVVRTGSHACAVSTGGDVRCWGEAWALGVDAAETIGDDETPATSRLVNGSWRAVQIASAYEHTCAVGDDARVYCWGHNWAGQLGANGLVYPTDVVAVTTARPIAAVAVGQSHSCALTDEGHVVCWGSNNVGQLGRGDTSDVLVPLVAREVALDGEAVAIASGWHFVCAVMRDGLIRCWGDGAEGKLGNDMTEIVGDEEGEMPSEIVLPP